MPFFISHIIEGIEHITDWNGYDHILFLLALAAPFALKDWMKVLKLATAFTLGHSLTLALSATDIIHFNRDLIEKLIPITIILTAVTNVMGLNQKFSSSGWLSYFITASFGLIHGMGFSSYFKMIYDEQSSIALGLLGFNLGVEIGQLLILAGTLVLLWLVVRTNLISQKSLTISLSLLAFCLSLWLLFG
jgi:HupE / UreJ protein